MNLKGKFVHIFAADSPKPKYQGEVRDNDKAYLYIDTFSWLDGTYYNSVVYPIYALEFPHAVFYNTRDEMIEAYNARYTD